MPENENIIVGLDIGTTKTACLVAKQFSDGFLDIVGFASHPSHGLRKGGVIDMDSTVESIRMAVEDAELMAGIEINEVYVGIAGDHIKSGNSNGVIATKKEKVTNNDILRVIDAAWAQCIPMDRVFIHGIPQVYNLDGKDYTKKPLGVSGARLEVHTHMVTASLYSCQNIIKCINRSGRGVKDIILNQLASAEAVLTMEEKDLGVCILDIGGGTTDIAIYADGHVQYTSCLPIGGSNLTDSICNDLKISAEEADTIKHKYGYALSSLVSPDESIEISGIKSHEVRSLPLHSLVEIVEHWAKELFTQVNQLIKEVIEEENSEDLGIVITGGSACIGGMKDLAEEVFAKSVRLGVPQVVGKLNDVLENPSYANVVGLILFASRNEIDISERLLSDEEMDPISINIFLSCILHDSVEFLRERFKHRGPTKTGTLGISRAGPYELAETGNWGVATAGRYGKAVAGRFGTAVIASKGEYMQVKKGMYGCAIAGDFGSASVDNTMDGNFATVGIGGSATAGRYGLSTAGNGGIAITGSMGTAVVGENGFASAGQNGKIIISYEDQKEKKLLHKTGNIGRDGLIHNKLYRVERGAFVEVSSLQLLLRKMKYIHRIVCAKMLMIVSFWWL